MGALELLDELRNSFDPSMLPIIMLTVPRAVPSTTALGAGNGPCAGGEAEGGDGQAKHRPRRGSSRTTVGGVLPDAAASPHSFAARDGVAALRRGANDYVVLPVLPVELEARINMQVALRRAVRIKAEASSSMQLLRAMLPGHVIRKLKAGQTYIAQYHASVTVAFIDGKRL